MMAGLPHLPRRWLWVDSRAGIALMTALTMPALFGVMGLGIDVGYWTVVRLELQRTVDVAAMAGAAKYASSHSSSSALTTTANVAELDGLPVGTRGGDGTTTLTDNYGTSYTATASFLTGPLRISMTVQRRVPVYFAKVLTSVATQPVSATAIVKIIPRPPTAPPCIFGLRGYSTGNTTGNDVQFGGSSSVTLSNGCEVRSNGNINDNGNPTVPTVPMIASGGCLSLPSGTNCSGGLPQMADPFAATYGSLLAVPTTTVNQSNGVTLDPAPSGYAYSGLSFQGNKTVTMSPGVYYVAGDITLNANTIVTGNGVTLITTGSIRVNGCGNVKNCSDPRATLTAPSTGPFAGLLWGSSSSSITLNGSATVVLQGATYFPNGTVTYSGNSTAATSCFEVVAAEVDFSGNATFNASGCSTMGIPPINDMPDKVVMIQ
jgi:Flp pilus assembly protein TadG